MLYIAHRGFTNFYPDNSLGAFNEAIREGFDMIELDIQLCKSGEIIVYHDLTIDNKYIIDLKYSELLQYNIITLKQFFEEVDTNKIKIYLDLKGDIQLVHVLIGLLIKHNINTQSIYIASFNFKHLSLLNFYKINIPNLNYNMGAIICNIYEKHIFSELFNDMYFICIDWNMLDEELIVWCNEHDIRVYSYTCRDMETYRFIMNYGIDGIVTDILLPPINV